MNNQQLFNIFHSRVLRNIFVAQQEEIAVTLRKLNVDEPPINTKGFLRKRKISNVIM